VNPNCLELEILETSALHDISKVSATMNACHKLGVRFALDDFGTGYSSLTHLRHLPAQLIKIDQSFVRDMLEDADDCSIVQGVIGLAKAFHRDVIAEGVETIAHGVALLQLGCDLAQGYGIARPMPGSHIAEWVSHWKADNFWKTQDHIVADSSLHPDYPQP
jgi:EAL domain-containing protein (putative c-di-GMP-specific phosphodiesterase class I)